MINSANFVKRLDKILEFYQLTATAFAEEIDFNRSTISHLLSGRNKPSLEFVVKLLEKFPEVEMDWLLFGKGNFPSTLEKKTVTAPARQKSNSSEEKILASFSEDSNLKKRRTESTQGSKQVEKIVIFYSDGSFNIYEN